MCTAAENPDEVGTEKRIACADAGFVIRSGERGRDMAGAAAEAVAQAGNASLVDVVGGTLGKRSPTVEGKGTRAEVAGVRTQAGADGSLKLKSPAVCVVGGVLADEAHQ